MAYVKLRLVLLQNTRWMSDTSLNSLTEVYQHHCKGPPLQKHKRDVFVKGNIEEVREDFQVSFEDDKHLTTRGGYNRKK